ncbi:hypothetical protein AAC387_Pa11g1047 [Persea americana]
MKQCSCILIVCMDAIVRAKGFGCTDRSTEISKNQIWATSRHRKDEQRIRFRSQRRSSQFAKIPVQLNDKDSVCYAPGLDLQELRIAGSLLQFRCQITEDPNSPVTGEDPSREPRQRLLFYSEFYNRNCKAALLPFFSDGGGRPS